MLESERIIATQVGAAPRQIFPAHIILGANSNVGAILWEKPLGIIRLELIAGLTDSG